MVAFAVTEAPALLRERARTLDESAFADAVERYRIGEGRSSPESFFARVVLQREAYLREMSAAPSAAGLCGRCGHPPQVGRLVAEGDGTSVRFCCSLCFDEWLAPRDYCPGCDGTEVAKLGYYRAPELAHVEARACETCGIYLHFVKTAVEPSAVPDVDEVVALPLDVWAHENGYRKLVPNLVGI